MSSPPPKRHEPFKFTAQDPSRMAASAASKASSSASAASKAASSASRSNKSTSSKASGAKENVLPTTKKRDCTGRKKQCCTARCHDPQTNSIHPYVNVMSRKLYKLKTLCTQIGELSDCNLVLCNRKSGVNNYYPNLDLADHMDLAAKELITLSKKLNLNAEKVRANADSEADKKRQKQDIVFMTEITDPSEKDQCCHRRRPHRLKYTQEFKPVIPPQIYVSDDDEMPQPSNNDPDTNFMFQKTNQTNPDKVQFRCDTCGKQFRDSNELNNHLSVHQYDLFRCMKCYKCCRSQFSFKKHMQTHNGTEIRCKVCDKRFDLKTSLINHMQKHREDKVVCPECNKSFTYRQNGLEHIEWAHHENKEVPCPVCTKYFQSPSQMRSHHSKRHGLVEDIVYHLMD